MTKELPSKPRAKSPSPDRSPTAKDKAEAKSPLPAQAIATSRMVAMDEAERISRKLARQGNYAKAIVLAMDIRESTTFMLHVEDFDRYARIIANFIAFVKHSAAEAGGWFDKFTGDGALLFWTTDSSLDTRSLVRVLDFATNIQQNFIEVTIPSFRVVAGCIPENFGLSVGIDYGHCLISNLRHDQALKIGDKSVPLEITQGAVTVLGRAVVGAVRMVSAAGPHEILLNEGPGGFFYRTWRKLAEEHPDTTIKRVLVNNKDLQGKQFAYLLGRRPIAEALVRHYNPDITEDGNDTR